LRTVRHAAEDASVYGLRVLLRSLCLPFGGILAAVVLDYLSEPLHLSQLSYADRGVLELLREEIDPFEELGKDGGSSFGQEAGAVHQLFRHLDFRHHPMEVVLAPLLLRGHC
jgi:hypothetical protein